MILRASAAFSASAIAAGLLLFHGGARATRVRYPAVDLGTLGGTNASASALNNRGQVVGWSNLANSEIHAFLWWKGAMRDLGNRRGRSMPPERSRANTTPTAICARVCGGTALASISAFRPMRPAGDCDQRPRAGRRLLLPAGRRSLRLFVGRGALG
jgi:probable HAF family extracellular repeat protein